VGERTLGLGLVGAGQFGRFCLYAYRALPGLRLVALCDSDQQRLVSVADEFGLAAYDDYAAMLANPQVDIVAVNTPPASHAALSIAAAQAGKHVFCEKPLATTIADAEAVLRAAQKAGVVLSVDYVMRPNPLYQLLKNLSSLQCSAGPVFGQLRRFALENFAADENLGPDHWFWDETVSGGIFVEHGVHFFDLFGWQLGALPQRVVALASRRNGDVTDIVQAVVEYEGAATGSFYHAFARAGAAEHQGITFGWDWATAELHGWIALDLTLHALVDAEGLAAVTTFLKDSSALLSVGNEPPLPGASLEWGVIQRFEGGRVMRGRGTQRRILAQIRLRATLGGQDAKMIVYEQCVRAGMARLVAAIREGRPAGVSASDLWTSTAVAVVAREVAISRCEVALPPMPFWLANQLTQF
jgi:predicted dehydrogenase